MQAGFPEFDRDKFLGDGQWAAGRHIEAAVTMLIEAGDCPPQHRVALLPSFRIGSEQHAAMKAAAIRNSWGDYKGSCMVLHPVCVSDTHWYLACGHAEREDQGVLSLAFFYLFDSMGHPAVDPSVQQLVWSCLTDMPFKEDLFPAIQGGCTQQQDSWSCGWRVIAVCRSLLRQVSENSPGVCMHEFHTCI